MTPAAAAPTRELQSSSWSRAAVPLIAASVLIGLVLQGAVGSLLPEATRGWLPFLVLGGAIFIAVGSGLAFAFPRVLVDAEGALVVRGRAIPPSQITGATRSLDSRGSSYLLYRLRAADGRPVRIVIAGSPIHGLRTHQIRLLREVIEASSIPAAGAPSAEVVAAEILATGRKVEVGREVLLAELESLAPSQGAVPAPPTADAVTPSAPDAFRGAPREAYEQLLAGIEEDDLRAEQRVRAMPAGLRLARRIAGWAFVATALGASALLAVIVAQESGGREFGAAEEDPVVAAMMWSLLAVLVAGVLWAALADLHEARIRRESLAWLDAATPDERRRGLPSVFQRAWTAAPGGRSGTFWWFVLAMAAMSAIIAGPVTALEFSHAVGPVTGWIVLAAGLALTWAAIAARRARAREHERRMQWLVEVSGQRITGPEPTGGADGPDVHGGAADSR